MHRNMADTSSLATPLISLGRVGRHSRVFLKDESVHPTGTFKDRLSSAAIAKADSKTLFGSISYGNTAVSFAQACASLPWANFVAFVPPDFANWTFGPSTTGKFITGRDIIQTTQSLGSFVLEVNLSHTILGDEELSKLALDAGLLDGRSFVNVTEGLEFPAYGNIAWEALEQMQSPPDICVVQFGAGILANEIRDVFSSASGQTIVIPISTPEPNSLARMLYGPIWLDVSSLKAKGVGLSRHESPDRTGVVRHPYTVYSVSEKQVKRGLEIANEYEISAEPSGSAGLGFLDALETIVPNYDPSVDQVLVINTGNGIDRLTKDGTW